MSSQVIEKSAKPRRSALRVGPGFDVLGHALKSRAAEFESWIYLVKGFGELQIKSAVIFRLHVLAVGFLAHFDVGDRISALLDVANLSGCIFGRAVEQGDGNNRGESTRDSAFEEEIKAGLVAGFHSVGSNI